MVFSLFEITFLLKWMKYMYFMTYYSIIYLNKLWQPMALDHAWSHMIQIQIQVVWIGITAAALQLLTLEI